MKAGDLVIKRNEDLGYGILIKRTYLAYDPNMTKWIVMFNNKIIEITQLYLRAI